MKVKDYLKQVKKIDTQIKNNAIEAKQLDEISAELSENVKKEIGRLYSERAEIIKNIEKLPEAEYDVLYGAYVLYKTLYEIANERGISYSNVTTIHGRALKRLDSIINANT